VPLGRTAWIRREADVFFWLLGRTPDLPSLAREPNVGGHWPSSTIDGHGPIIAPMVAGEAHRHNMPVATAAAVDKPDMSANVGRPPTSKDGTSLPSSAAAEPPVFEP
jgi:hypothetical protein